MNLAGRIVFFIFLLWGGGLVFFVRSEITENSQRYREATEEPLSDVAHLLASLVTKSSNKIDQLSLSPLKEALEEADAQPLNASIYKLNKSAFDMIVYVTDEKGVVIFDSRGGRDVGKDYSRWNDVYLALKGGYGARSSKDDPLRPGEGTFYVAVPIVIDGAMRGVLSVGKPGRNAETFIKAARRSIRRGALYTFLGVALLTLVVAIFMQRPLRKLTEYARAVRDGVNPPLPTFSLRELSTLAKALHEMRLALQGKQYIEQYAQTLTHEIKSPVTGIKGALEILRDAPDEKDRAKFITNIEVETNRIEKLAESLLSLSSLEAKEMKREDTIILSELFAKILEKESVRINQKSLAIERHFPPSTQTFTGNRFWLESALSNIFSNALEFSPLRGKVTITIREEGKNIICTIDDNGPGIPEWALTKVYDKFFSLPRPDSNKKSSGLGLTIVQQVLAVHNAEIQLSNRAEGGIRATVEFEGLGKGR